MRGSSIRCRKLSSSLPQTEAVCSTASLQAAEAANVELRHRLLDATAEAEAKREADVAAAADAAANSAAVIAQREKAAATAAELGNLKEAHTELQQLQARCRICFGIGLVSFSPVSLFWLWHLVRTHEMECVSSSPFSGEPSSTAGIYVPPGQVQCAANHSR